jgi:hypothetical protein
MFSYHGATEREDMIDEYLEGAITQARERARTLKAKIPGPVPAPEFAGLHKVCEERIDRLIELFDFLLKDDAIRRKDSAKERIRLFRRAVGDLAQLEATGVAALSRHHEDDILLNRLVFEIHQEINYPLAPPTVTCLSQQYFLIHTSLGLLAVPLAESDFLLHLPDLYHEIAHPLISSKDNPKVQGFQNEFGKFQEAVLQHFEAERASNIRATGPKEYFAYVLDLLERWWVQFWAAEFFCDLFAAYTLGPAYAWAHLHLTATRGGDPFELQIEKLMSHPPDEARMEAILLGLDLLGRQAEATQVKQRWNNLIEVLGTKKTSLYLKACPRLLLEKAVVHALQGTKNVGCRLADSENVGKIQCLLNTAWGKFWESPREYHVWEKEQIRQLREAAKS